jgi:hypothetical protein
MARTTLKTLLLLSELFFNLATGCLPSIHLRGNLFTNSLPSNGCMCNSIIMISGLVIRVEWSGIMEQVKVLATGGTTGFLFWPSRRSCGLTNLPCCGVKGSFSWGITAGAWNSPSADVCNAAVSLFPLYAPTVLCSVTRGTSLYRQYGIL